MTAEFDGDEDEGFDVDEHLDLMTAATAWTKVAAAKNERDLIGGKEVLSVISVEVDEIRVAGGGGCGGEVIAGDEWVAI